MWRRVWTDKEEKYIILSSSGVQEYVEIKFENEGAYFESAISLSNKLMSILNYLEVVEKEHLEDQRRYFNAMPSFVGEGI
jgi:hypothetical protein